MPSIEKHQSVIHYTETGSGEPVLIIHCSSASGTEWSSLCEVLSRRFRCVVPDQWNCGYSGVWPGHRPFSLEGEAAPIAGIIDRIGIPVHLVGHSYGGGVALRVARERPAMIASLTLIEPSVFHLLRDGGPRERRLYREIRSVAGAVKRAVASGDYWGGMGRFVDYWNGDGAWDRMSSDARLKLSQRLGKVVLDFKALFDEPTTIEGYATIRAPVLLVCGDRSPGPSRRLVELLADAMHDATVARIEGAGHMSPLTHPGPVNAAIASFLSRASSTPRRRVA